MDLLGDSVSTKEKLEIEEQIKEKKKRLFASITLKIFLQLTPMLLTSDGFCLKTLSYSRNKNFFNLSISHNL